MSLSDHEARAMAVKMLDADELKLVHAAEEKKGYQLLPWEIALKSRKARMSSANINKWWGIPSSSVAQANHAARIKEDIRDLMRVKNCHVNMGDAESRANFDWQIFHSEIDFAYNGLRKAVAPAAEDLFETPPKKEKYDGQAAASGGDE